MTSRADYQSIEAFLKPIPGASPVGENLHYDRLYDQIREARREDDPRLSQGVWKVDLKEAEWFEVERLCAETLLTKTKDLRLTAWLTEAWTALDKFQGLTRGITVFTQLADQFWETIYPLNDDEDVRYNLVDWYLKIIYARIILVPITFAEIEGTKYHYAHYIDAVRLDTLSKRQTSPKEFLEKSSKNSIIMTEFMRSLAQTAEDSINQKLSDLAESMAALKVFSETLSKRMSLSSTRKVEDVMLDIKRLLTNELNSRKKEIPLAAVPVSSASAESKLTPASSASPGQTQPPGSAVTLQALSSRSEAYKQLSQIANYLEKIEPHSPTPRLLKQIVTWEDKNLIDIFNQIAQTPQDFAVLMKLLGSKV